MATDDEETQPHSIRFSNQEWSSIRTAAVRLTQLEGTPISLGEVVRRGTMSYVASLLSDGHTTERSTEDESAE